MKYLLVLLIVISCSTNLVGQTQKKLTSEFDEGSQILFTYEDIGSQEVEKLYTLCKVWGFLKYHHPTVAKGNYNWDYELFRVLPAIEVENFKARIEEWILSIGKVSECESEPIPKGWLDSLDLSQVSINELRKIKNSYRDSTHYYLDFTPGVKNPVFQNENAYPYMEWDLGYRLLALFRYWNMIEYFFPYKHLMDEDWDKILKEFIPKIASSTDELSYRLTLLELIGNIHDTHANIWGNDRVLNYFFGLRIAPIEISFVEDRPIITHIPDSIHTSIKRGDIVTSIGGISIAQLIQKKIKHCPASNYPTQLRDLAIKLVRTNKDSITLSVLRDKNEFIERFKTAEYKYRLKNFPSHKELPGAVGYIFPGTLKEHEIDTIMQSFIKKKSLIIDLRCYPSEFIVFSLGKYLVNKQTEFAKFTTGSLENPGTFSYTQPVSIGETNQNHFQGKVIVLVNERTQSQAEYTAMAFRVAPKAIVIGSTTAGADGNLSWITLPGNVRTAISGIGVYYPDGTETQRVGILPDIEIYPTISGVTAGRDEILEKALQVIKD